MKIAIGGDHGGYKLKEFLKGALAADYEFRDCGTDSEDSADYPVFAAKVANAVSSGECDFGIAICTTGIGVSIAANKVRGVRAALCCDIERVKMSRRHNNANVLCFGAAYIEPETAVEMTKVFLSTEFDGVKPGQERHARRVEEIGERVWVPIGLNPVTVKPSGPHFRITDRGVRLESRVTVAECIRGSIRTCVPIP